MLAVVLVVSLSVLSASLPRLVLRPENSLRVCVCVCVCVSVCVCV